MEGNSIAQFKTREKGVSNDSELTMKAWYVNISCLLIVRNPKMKNEKRKKTVNHSKCFAVAVGLFVVYRMLI